MQFPADSEYEAFELLHQEQQTVLYRASCARTGKRVLIKTLQMEYPTPQDVLKLKYEYEMAKRAASLGVVAPIGLERYRHTWLLLLEDGGGEMLRQVLDMERLHLSRFFDLAIALAEAILQLHRKNIIHRDLRPENLLVRSVEPVVKITNFSSAAWLPDERSDEQVFESYSAYSSPEQTGRMNRMADHRSDLYSAGVIFYEMLTGRLPFEEQNAVKLIYQHFTQEAVSPALLNPQVPTILGDLVLKCLAKDAEERYQSAFGLLHDLTRCKDQWREHGRIEDLILGEEDRSEHFHLSNLVYGREREMETLQAAFERTRRGGSEGVLLVGPAGIGKSTLVRELNHRVSEEPVCFLEGKFEQNIRHAPYEGVLQALKQWVMRILAEGEVSIAWWKEEILRALGQLSGVLVEALPALKLIVGSQPPVPILPAQETNNRFLLAILQVLSILPTAQHPVLLFLDDLQWADPASAHLIAVLLTERKIPHLLVIGSYRVEQEGADIPLLERIAKLQTGQATLIEMHVRPLTVFDVQKLLQDTLRSSGESVAQLAQSVTEKTGGSPFVVKQFVQALPAKGLLSLEVQTGEWRWDMDTINALAVNESQVEYILSTIRELPERARHLLGAAACIGMTFSLETLQHVLTTELSAIARDLLLLIEERLLYAKGTSSQWLYRLPEADEQIEWQNQLQFAHDRIQQAAYASVAEDEKKRIHLLLARQLQTGSDADLSADLQYEQVNHFNRALDRLETQAEREYVAQLNLAVAKRAKAALDYEQALRFCENGIALLTENCWQDQHALTFELYRERFELVSFGGQVAEADRYFALLLQHAKTDVEKLPIYKFRILTVSRENRAQKSFELGMEALRQFGMKRPLQSDVASRTAAYVRIRSRLTKKRIQNVTALPFASDAKVIAQMEILWAMAVVMLVVDEKVMIRLILKILELSLAHGPAAPTCTAYIMYGNLVAQRGNFELSAAYGQLGVETEVAYWRRQGGVSCQGLFSYTTNIMPFVAPMRDVNRSFATVLQRAQETGDLRIFANSLVMKVHGMIASGIPLDEVQAELQKGLPAVRISNNEWLLQASQILMGAVRNLIGQGAGPFELSHPDFDEAKYRQTVLEGRQPNQMQPLNYLYSKLLLLFLAGEYGQALLLAEEMEREKMFPRGHFVEVNFFYLYALTLTQHFDQLEEQEQTKAWKKIGRLQKLLHRAAQRCPENYRHKSILLAAEVARLKGHSQRAMDLYDQAVSRALEQQFWNDEGIAHECAANFYLHIGKTQIAHSYLRAAYHAFLKWGAKSKAMQMKARYPHLFGEELSAVQREHNLDYLAVIKSAQAITGEIVLPKLIEKMMQILLENAGAQVGTMLFEQHGRFVPHDTEVEVSQAVVHYVTRTGESVVLHDACQEGLFRNDLSLQTRQVKSLLCLPVRHQAKQVGLLYLENNLTTHAFTDERVELLQLLSTQLAISIENANLYANLEEKVRSRTADLEESKRQLERSIAETARAWSDVAVLEERTRIAHELHDVIGHTLTTSVVQMESCKRLAAKDLTKALPIMDAIQDNLRNGLHEVRISVRMLKDNISQMEVGQALEKLLLDAQTQIGLEIEYQIDPMPNLDAKLRKTLYHALQEGLTNGVRHGKSTKFQFRLYQEHGTIHFELRDNGIGFQDSVFGFGLTTMRERIEEVGGKQLVSSAPGEGCKLRLVVPIP
ncbi:AAA family ATPase [Tumebacillus algifaecis]|nr:AAA family ATPase [Tumebacillus algifaecis]